MSSGSQIVSATANASGKTEQMIPFFGPQLLTTDPRWWAVEVETGAGSDPGTARVRIPMNAATDVESAFSLVFNEDALAQFQHGNPMMVARRSWNAAGMARDEQIFVGQIVKVEQVVDDASLVDCLEVIGKDIRHQLQDVRAFGRWVSIPKVSDNPQYSAGETISFQEGWAAHFNPGGRPNCIFDSRGEPFFSPHPDFGLSEDEAVPNASKGLTRKACYWTLHNILRYFRNTIGPDPIVEYPADFPYLVKCPSWLVWPETTGSSLDSGSAQTGSGFGRRGSGGARKGRDMNMNGLSLCGDSSRPGIFDIVLSAAGGMTWTIEYQFDSATGAYKNILRIIPSRWKAENPESPGVRLNMPFACGGNAKDTLKFPCITGGRYIENSEAMASRVVGSGSIIKIETRCSSRAEDHGGGTRTAADREGNGTPALLPAWSAADELDCLRYAAWLGGGSFAPEHLVKAFARKPYVFSAFVLNPDFDFQAGTDQEGRPRAKMTRPIWPFLLSFRGSFENVGDVAPYPIRIEAFIEDSLVPSEDGWDVGPELDGLEVWDNGIIFLPGLRDAVLNGGKGSWRWNGAEGAITGTYDESFESSTVAFDISANDIRMSMAVPCDHRLAYASKVGADVTDLANENQESFFQVDVSTPDWARMAEEFTRTLYLDLNGLYDLWLRKNSWPEPESTQVSAMAPNKPQDTYNPDGTSNALRSDRQLLRSHVVRQLEENFRLDRSESFLRWDGWLVTGYQPGIMIDKFVPVGVESRKPFNARCVILRKRYMCEPVPGLNGAPAFHCATWMMIG